MPVANGLVGEGEGRTTGSGGGGDDPRPGRSGGGDVLDGDPSERLRGHLAESDQPGVAAAGGHDRQHDAVLERRGARGDVAVAQLEHTLPRTEVRGHVDAVAGDPDDGDGCRPVVGGDVGDGAHSRLVGRRVVGAAVGHLVERDLAPGRPGVVGDPEALALGAEERPTCVGRVDGELLAPDPERLVAGDRPPLVAGAPAGAAVGAPQHPAVAPALVVAVRVVVVACSEHDDVGVRGRDGDRRDAVVRGVHPPSGHGPGDHELGPARGRLVPPVGAAHVGAGVDHRRVPVDARDDAGDEAAAADRHRRPGVVVRCRRLDIRWSGRGRGTRRRGWVVAVAAGEGDGDSRRGDHREQDRRDRERAAAGRGRWCRCGHGSRSSQGRAATSLPCRAGPRRSGQRDTDLRATVSSFGGGDRGATRRGRTSAARRRSSEVPRWCSR